MRTRHARTIRVGIIDAAKRRWPVAIHGYVRQRFASTRLVDRAWSRTYRRKLWTWAMTARPPRGPAGDSGASDW